MRMHRPLPENLPLLGAEHIERALGLPDMPLGHLGISRGRLDGRMTQQLLNRANVRPGLKQMGGKSVSQAMGRDALLEAGSNDHLVQPR